MKFYSVLVLFFLSVMTGCATSPQSVSVDPVLSLEGLKDVSTPLEIIVSDKRNNVKLFGFRNAKNEGEILFSDSVSKSLGESIQNALIYQGVNMTRSPKPVTKLEVELHELVYTTPDESWVSSVEVRAEVLLIVSRANSSLRKRFKANRKQDVVTAPTQEFNEKFMNTLLSELMNKALNDSEIANFLMK